MKNEKMTVNEFFGDPRMTREILDDLLPTSGELKAFLRKRGAQPAAYGTNVGLWPSFEFGRMTNVKALKALKTYFEEVFGPPAGPAQDPLGQHLGFLAVLEAAGISPKEILKELLAAGTLLRRCKAGANVITYGGQWSLHVQSRIVGFGVRIAVDPKTDFSKEIKKTLKDFLQALQERRVWLDERIKFVKEVVEKGGKDGST